MSAQSVPARAVPDRRSSAVPKRTSMLPKPSSMVVDPTALIAQHAQLTGMQPVTLGPHTVLHPHCKISSVLSPVVLGPGVIVYEKAKIGVGMGFEADRESRPSSVASGRGSASIKHEGTLIGTNVVIESNAIVEASEIGEGTVIEVGATVGRGCVVGKYCTIAAGTVVPPNTRLPDFTVVFSGSQQRVDKTLESRPSILEARVAVHLKQLEMFRKLIPNNIAKWA